MSRFAVHYSRHAVAALRDIGWQRRRRLERALNVFAASAPVGGLRRVETPPHVAACEVMEDERIVLVFAVLASRELLELLWGEAFERRIRHRGGERLTHGRWRGRGLGIRSGGAGGGR